MPSSQDIAAELHEKVEREYQSAIALGRRLAALEPALDGVGGAAAVATARHDLESAIAALAVAGEELDVESGVYNAKADPRG